MQLPETNDIRVCSKIAEIEYLIDLMIDHLSGWCDITHTPFTQGPTFRPSVINAYTLLVHFISFQFHFNFKYFRRVALQQCWFSRGPPLHRLQNKQKISNIKYSEPRTVLKTLTKMDINDKKYCIKKEESSNVHLVSKLRPTSCLRTFSREWSCLVK